MRERRGKEEESGAREGEGCSPVYTYTQPSERPSGCGLALLRRRAGHSGSGRCAAGACSVRVARAGRTQGEIEGTSGALSLERAKRQSRSARGASRGPRRRHEDLLAAQRLGVGLLPNPLPRCKVRRRCPWALSHPLLHAAGLGDG